MRAPRKVFAASLAVLFVAARSAAAPVPGSSPAEAGPRICFSLAARPALDGERPIGAGPAVRSETPGLRLRPRLARAWSEWGAFVTVSSVNYWLSNSFPEDADYRLTLDDQVRRLAFLDGVKFDSNQFSLNWSHILGGALYYQFGRTNHTSWPAALLMSVAGSTWWETIGEPKEVVAINDQIITGLGGFPVGEAWYQASQFLLHRPAFLERALSVINPFLLINRWLDRRDAAIRAYDQPGWHDFSVFVGGRRLASDGSAARTDLYLGVRTRLIELAEYGRPGEVHRRFKDTAVSELGFDIAVQNGRAAETRWAAQAVPWGWFDQRIDRDGNGHSLMFGFGSAFEFFKKRPLADYDATPVPVKSDLSRLHLDEPRAFTDKLAILHVAGPVLDWTIFRRGLRLRTVVEGYGDFGLINATALNDYSAVHPVAGLWTTVFYYGYFYGFGGSGAASFSLDYRGLEARGRAETGVWSSARFLDRFQTEVTNRARIVDARTLFRGGLGWTLPRTSLKIFADLEYVRRGGRLDGVKAARVETKTYVGLAFSF